MISTMHTVWSVSAQSGFHHMHCVRQRKHGPVFLSKNSFRGHIYSYTSIFADLSSPRQGPPLGSPIASNRYGDTC